MPKLNGLVGGADDVAVIPKEDAGIEGDVPKAKPATGAFVEAGTGMNAEPEPNWGVMPGVPNIGVEPNGAWMVAGAKGLGGVPAVIPNEGVDDGEPKRKPAVPKEGAVSELVVAAEMASGNVLAEVSGGGLVMVPNAGGMLKVFADVEASGTLDEIVDTTDVDVVDGMNGLSPNDPKAMGAAGEKAGKSGAIDVGLLAPMIIEL